MMKERVLSRSIRMICVAGVAVGMHAAYADENAEPVQKVQITGSRLSTPGAESPSPLQVLTSADIAASGVANLQDLLQKNPTMGTPTLSRTNSNFLTSGGGVSTVNLRNLGDSRTLVLVNGRRFVSGVPGDSAVDLNTIPVDFIERVDMLTGGASATYGSDAVAGVVNIILKKNFEGLTVDAQTGKSNQGDDFKKKLAITFGTTSADGASNIMGHFGYSKQGAVFSRDRDASAVDQTSAIKAGHPELAFVAKRPFYSGYAPQGHFYADSEDFTYDKNNGIIPWNGNGAPGTGAGATGYNRSASRTIAVPTERYLFSTVGNIALNENHSAFFEGTYAQTKVDTNIEPFPLGSDNIFPASGGQVPAGHMVNGVLVKNPLVPQYLYDRISDNDGDGVPDYFFTRRLSEFGPRHSTVDRDTFRLATGLKGTIKDWNYETYISYGKTKEAQSSTGQVNVMSMRNALDAIPDGSGGVQCADANAVSEGCVPINIFGFNSISPEALKYVTAPGSLLTAITQKLAGGSISGELPWGLEAGKIGLATGFEWRDEDSSSVADPLTQAGLNAGNATPPTYGNFHVKEAFLETRVPLLKDKAYAKDLSFLGTWRSGDYSSVGNANSWNAGFEWAVTQDFKLRATRAQSTRAPNINELYTAPSQDFPSVQDPCEGAVASGTSALDINCHKAPGVAENQAAHGGVFTLGQPDKQGVSGYNSGNPNLKAEQGRSTTIGLVVTPRSIPMLSKFTFTADWFKVDISNAIVSTDRQYALDQCYNHDNQAFCSFITRRPTQLGNYQSGSIKYSNTAVTNSGGAGTEGIDLTASWADKVGPGRLSTHLAYTYLKTLWNKATPDAEINEDAGEVAGNSPVSNAPKHKAVLNLAYKWGAFGVNSTTTYNGRVALDDQFLKSLSITPGSVVVGSKTYQDFQFTYDVKKKIQLYLGINNAFDAKAPPLISGLPGDATGTETDASTYDAIGRRYYVGLRVSM